MTEKNAVNFELEAIKTVVDALNGLDEQAQKRVLKYTLDMLSINLDYGAVVEALPIPSLVNATSAAEPFQAKRSENTSEVTDIKTLKNNKKPTSANEMTALVAFYLAEHAPQEDRKSEISSEDIEKYFKQAAFPLPKQLRSALPNALNAGYLDKASFGKYRLNPVGYNLIAHKLGSAQSQGSVIKAARGKAASKRK